MIYNIVQCIIICKYFGNHNQTKHMPFCATLLFNFATKSMKCVNQSTLISLNTLELLKCSFFNHHSNLYSELIKHFLVIVNVHLLIASFLE